MAKKNQNASDPRRLKLVLEELDNNPYRQFNIAFALMSLIPFMVFFYLLVGRVATLDILTGNIGLVLAITLFISACGFYLGYIIIKKILNKIILYAVKAKHSDQLKSAFVATVSHELKNPITVIKMNLFNILKGLAGRISEEQKKVIEVCREVADRMSRLVGGLLDLHRIEAGMIERRRVRHNLFDILETQVKEFESVIAAKNIKLTQKTPGRELFIWLDNDKIARVINNVLGNAVKYTPPGGRINLSVTSDAGLVRLECSDSGPGIPPDKIDKIFDKFERADTVKEGTGLGLAIVKDIVELHQGKIWAENLAGGGSKFVIILPCDLRQVQR